MTRMEELKEELEALKVQLLQQGGELERLRSNPSSIVQDGTSTHSAVIPPFPRGAVEMITNPRPSLSIIWEKRIYPKLLKLGGVV